jgi:hypothetical protein
MRASGLACDRTGLAGDFFLAGIMMDNRVESCNAEFAPHTETAVEESKPTGLELLIGSNVFRNTNGVLKIDGKEQLVLESKPEQGLLLLTIDLYGEDGLRLAHIRRNVPVVNKTGQFTVEVHRVDGDDSRTHAPWIRLFNQQSSEIVLEARLVSENRVQITSGRFYSHQGTLVEITPHYCRIGAGTTRFGDIADNRGGTVVLG